jgi:hypothetical protein
VYCRTLQCTYRSNAIRSELKDDTTGSHMVATKQPLRRRNQSVFSCEHYVHVKICCRGTKLCRWVGAPQSGITESGVACSRSLFSTQIVIGIK